MIQYFSVHCNILLLVLDLNSEARKKRRFLCAETAAEFFKLPKQPGIPYGNMGLLARLASCAGGLVLQCRFRARLTKIQHNTDHLKGHDLWSEMLV